MAEDCCDKQHLGEIKTEAARLLEVVCDRSEAYARYVVQFCVVSVQAAVMKGDCKIENVNSLLPL